MRLKSGIETRMTTSDTIMWLLMRVGIEKKFKIKLPPKEEVRILRYNKRKKGYEQERTKNGNH